MLIHLVIILAVAIIQCNTEDPDIYYRYTVGHFQIVNNCNEDILVTKFTHALNNKVFVDGRGATITLYDIPVKARNVSTVFQFDCETGHLPNLDYWYVRVLHNGTIWDTNGGHFHCNITPNDLNGTVALIVNMDSKELEVAPPKSTPCKIRLTYLATPGRLI